MVGLSDFMGLFQAKWLYDNDKNMPMIISIAWQKEITYLRYTRLW